MNGPDIIDRHRAAERGALHRLRRLGGGVGEYLLVAALIAFAILLAMVVGREHLAPAAETMGAAASSSASPMTDRATGRGMTGED